MATMVSPSSPDEAWPEEDVEGWLPCCICLAATEMQLYCSSIAWVVATVMAELGGVWPCTSVLLTSGGELIGCEGPVGRLTLSLRIPFFGGRPGRPTLPVTHSRSALAHLLHGSETGPSRGQRSFCRRQRSQADDFCCSNVWVTEELGAMTRRDFCSEVEVDLDGNSISVAVLLL